MFTIVFVSVGVLMIAAGIGVGHFWARAAAAAAARAARLASLSAAELQAAQPGQEVLIEGRVSAANRPIFREFVAYVRQEYRGSDEEGEENWTTDRVVAPALTVDLADGPARLASGYAIEDPSTTWDEDRVLHWNDVTGHGTGRYQGFLVGDEVIAIGAVAPGGELDAKLLCGGTRAAYLAARQGTARVLPLVGAGLGAAGAVFAILGAILGPLVG